MKKKILKISIVLAIGIIIYGAYYTLTFPNLNKYKTEIREKYSYNKSSNKKDYRKNCENEFMQKINFPLEKPKYGIIHFDKFWKIGKKLNEKQLNEILVILNDSSAYNWGEIGTPYFDKFITFYNTDDKCIGLIEMSNDGQTYSSPNLNRMKWGLLKNEKQNELEKIIDE